MNFTVSFIITNTIHSHYEAHFNALNIFKNPMTMCFIYELIRIALTYIGAILRGTQRSVRISLFFIVANKVRCFCEHAKAANV